MPNHDETQEAVSPAADTTNGEQSKVWGRRIAIVIVAVALVGLLVYVGLIVKINTYKSVLELLKDFAFGAASIVWIYGDISKRFVRRKRLTTAGTPIRSSVLSITRCSSYNWPLLIIFIVVFLVLNFIFFLLINVSYNAGYIGHNPSLEPLGEIGWFLCGIAFMILGIASIVDNKKEKLGNS